MTYDFICTNCDYLAQMTFKISEVPKTTTCPTCTGDMRQYFSGDNPFILNGKGWDKPAHYK